MTTIAGSTRGVTVECAKHSIRTTPAVSRAIPDHVFTVYTARNGGSSLVDGVTLKVTGVVVYDPVGGIAAYTNVVAVVSTTASTTGKCKGPGI